MKKTERQKIKENFQKIAAKSNTQKTYEAYSKNYDRIAKNNLMIAEKLPNPKTGDLTFISVMQAIKAEAGGAVPNLGREIARSYQAATRTEARKIVSSAAKMGYSGLKVTNIQNMPKEEPFKFFFEIRKNEIRNDPSKFKEIEKNVAKRISEYKRSTGVEPSAATVSKFREKALNDLARPTAAAITSG